MPTSQQTAASKAKVNPAWPLYASAVVLAFVLLGSFLRWAVLDWADPYNCSALLNTGQWLDPGTFQNWQPDNCLHIPPSPGNLLSCLVSPSGLVPLSPSSSSHRQLLFIGDSVVRQTFFASVRLLDGSIPKSWEQEGEKHSDREIVIAGKDGTNQGDSLRVSFWWDPYLNASRTAEHFSQPTSSPSLLVIGSGLWYLRNPASGGLASWEAIIDRTFSALASSQLAKASQHFLAKPLSTPWSLSAVERPVADTIIFLPVVNPVEALLNDARAETIIHTDVEAMNADLLARLSHPSPPPLHIPTVFNKLLVDSETKDGLHFSDKILNKQAELLLAWRCNDHGQGSGQNEGTCCRRYRWLRPVQLLVLALFVVWAPLTRIVAPRIAPSSRIHHFLLPPALAVPLTTFGFALLYLFLADRTTVFLKEQKQFDPWVFGSVTVAFLALGLATSRDGGKDQGFLGREMTDEWKGWMQIAILIYHIFGGSKVSGIYNPIRVLVASYLFMTGYGHFFYYYKKRDFGFQRIAMVMVRLNLLSIALPYTMHTNYVFYYFAPLVSWWYIIIYVTMAVGNRYNERPLFMLAKILSSATLHTLFIKNDWMLASLFDLLRTIFRIEWSAREWTFRVSLDLYIVYGGMVCAYTYILLKHHSIPEHPRFSSLVVGITGLAALGMGWYFWFELSLPNKFVYNAYHPVVCFVPILAYIVLRNATTKLRSCSSRLFCFIGRCSLETFILQFHGWMASDTKGLLLVIPGTRWRTINLVLSTVCFVWLSHKVAGATGEITEWFVVTTRSVLPPPVASGPLSSPAEAEVGASRGPGGATTVPRPSEDIAMTQRPKEEKLGTKPSSQSETGADDAEERRGSVPNWMAATAAHLSGRSIAQGYADINRPLREETLLSLVAKTRDLARRRVSVKLGLCLLALWIANWLY